MEQRPETEVICFDFFDTLVYRIVEPEETKRLASRQLGILLGNEVTGSMLYQCRRDLEAELCRQQAASGGDLEFSLGCFAPLFFKLLRNKYPHFPEHVHESSFSEWVLHIEIAVEKLVQRINPAVYELLLSIDKEKVRVAMISDFYIPKRYFESILNHHGLSRHFEQLFISADYGVKKSSGRLYEKVVEYFHCPPEGIVMIGDNEHSDIRMAQKKALRTFPVLSSKTSVQAPSIFPKTEKAILSKDLEREIRNILSLHGGNIFPEIGVSLYRFIFLLFQNLVREGIDRVFFLSKEGEFLKSLFDQFQIERFGIKIIESHYLMVSRKSTYICSLNPLNEENFKGIFQQYRDISPRDFLLSLNFSEEDARSICREIAVEHEKRIPAFQHSTQFQAIIGLKSFNSLYEQKRKNQKKLFLRYLESFGIDFYNKGLTLIDVGWKGSIQDNLFHILERKVKIKGYYIGLLNPTNITEINQKSGILFTNHLNENSFFDVYRSNTSLFEIVLGATHGSADHYSESDDTVRVNLVDSPEERILYEDKIQPVQVCINSVFSEINRLASVTMELQPGEAWYAKQHARMVYRPIRKEISFFKEIYHLENFGVFEFTDFKRQENLPLGKRWDNLKQVIQQPRFISDKGIWHPILLEKLGIGFTTPYFGETYYRKAFSENKAGFKFTGGKVIRNLARIPVKKHIRIAFFLGIPEISGGTYVIFEHAVRLNRKGYAVFILTREAIHPKRYAWHPEAGELEWITVENAGQLHFDFAFATWWQSAILLSQVSASTYGYFVQSIESRFFPSDETATSEESAYQRLAESTYLLPVPVITEAGWIRTYLNKKYGIDAFLVQNGIRKEIYTEVGDVHASRTKGKLRVLVEGPLGIPYKNVEKAIALSRKSEADEIWLLTPSKTDSFEGVHRVFSQVSIHETAPIYRSCDVLLKLSTVEGMFGPPLEMLHCGGTAIVYDVTGHEEYIRHNVNSLVLPKGDEEGVIHHLNLLKKEPKVLERLKTGATATASKWPDWDSSSNQFEKVLNVLRGRSWPNRAYLSEASRYLFRNCENDIKLHLEREDKPSLQCFQMFWHQGEGFSETASWKCKYKSSEWISFQKKLRTDPKSVYLRVDPCMQEGIVFVDRISIGTSEKKQPLMVFNASFGWGGVEATGTASRIFAGKIFAVESTGNDPQIVIPAVAIDGNYPFEIVFDIVLKFLPYRKALHEIIAVLESEENIRGLKNKPNKSRTSYA